MIQMRNAQIAELEQQLEAERALRKCRCSEKHEENPAEEFDCCCEKHAP